MLPPLSSSHPPLLFQPENDSGFHSYTASLCSDECLRDCASIPVVVITAKHRVPDHSRILEQIFVGLVQSGARGGSASIINGRYASHHEDQQFDHDHRNLTLIGLRCLGWETLGAIDTLRSNNEHPTAVVPGDLACGNIRLLDLWPVGVYEAISNTAENSISDLMDG
jgi:hypothetical protein